MNRGDEKIREAYEVYKARHRLNAGAAAARLAIPERTLARRLKEPGKMTVAELRRLVCAAGADRDEVWAMITGRRT